MATHFGVVATWPGYPDRAACGTPGLAAGGTPGLAAAPRSALLAIAIRLAGCLNRCLTG
jgi:hypothetical protein